MYNINNSSLNILTSEEKQILLAQILQMANASEPQPIQEN